MQAALGANNFQPRKVQAKLGAKACVCELAAVREATLGGAERDSLLDLPSLGRSKLLRRTSSMYPAAAHMGSTQQQTERVHVCIGRVMVMGGGEGEPRIGAASGAGACLTDEARAAASHAACSKIRRGAIPTVRAGHALAAPAAPGPDASLSPSGAGTGGLGLSGSLLPGPGGRPLSSRPVQPRRQTTSAAGAGDNCWRQGPKSASPLQGSPGGGGGQDELWTGETRCAWRGGRGRRTVAWGPAPARLPVQSPVTPVPAVCRTSSSRESAAASPVKSRVTSPHAGWVKAFSAGSRRTEGPSRALWTPTGAARGASRGETAAGRECDSEEGPAIAARRRRAAHPPPSQLSPQHCPARRPTSPPPPVVSAASPAGTPKGVGAEGRRGGRPAGSRHLDLDNVRQGAAGSRHPAAATAAATKANSRPAGSRHPAAAGGGRGDGGGATGGLTGDGRGGTAAERIWLHVGRDAARRLLSISVDD
jgi:hypothetical protein